jgi:hypothetical protein
MRKSTESTFHQPNVVVQPACVESCKHLPERVGAAIVESITKPNTQKVVVCPQVGRLLCHSIVLTEGTYGHDFGERVDGSDELYLSNPSDYQIGTRNTSVRQEVQNAISKGAELYSTHGTKIVAQEIEVAAE